MENLNHKMANYFQDNQTLLVDELLPGTLNELELDYTEKDLNQHYEMLRSLLDRVAKSLLRTDEETDAAEPGYDSENYFYAQGLLLKQTVDVLCVFRLSLLKHLSNSNLIHQARVEEGLEVAEQIIFAFDAAIRATTENYNLLKEKEHEEFERSLNHISTPVVLIDDSQAVVPLVGEFSSERFEVVMENTLQKIKEYGLRVLYLDFSGIATFNHVFINDIYNLTQTIELLGTRTILTGIKTEMAAAAVKANMSFENLETFGELRHALDSINKK
ncbi:STAS domain-containing protein [Halobacillus mangrovi]|uniref:STAS domain-containing protein n=1 Tax=Halobacillus mangrovi TaxID=402384 RepID=UPI003D97A29D